MYRWIPAVIGLSLAVGCVSTEVAPQEAKHAPLIVAKSGDTAIISWTSSSSHNYTVLFKDGTRHGGQWRALPGASLIRGTGADIRIEDRLAPGQQRSYRLMAMPITSVRR